MKKICGVIWVTFLALMVSAAYAEPVQWRVQDGGNGHWYDVVYVPPVEDPENPGSYIYISWSDAKLAAEAAGGYLATVHSQAEQDILFALVEQQPKYWYNDMWGNGMGPWLGGIRNPGSSNWMWVTGEPWAYTNWAPGEPNNSNGSEGCLQIFSQGGYQLWKNQWNDLSDRPWVHGYFVEYESAPRSFNLTRDWSDEHNPNGVWTLRSGAVPLIWNTTQNRWARPEPAHLPMCEKTTTDNSYNGQVNYEAGDIVCHSTDNVNGGYNGPFNVAWTAPYGGIVSVEGKIWYAHSQEVRGNDWTLSLEETDLAAGTISHGSSNDRNNPVHFDSSVIAGQTLTNLTVQKGDIVKLEVTKRSVDVYGSFTGIDMTVYYTRVSFDLDDFRELAATWQYSSGDPEYNDIWDLADTDTIDLDDLTELVASWLTTLD